MNGEIRFIKGELKGKGLPEYLSEDNFKKVMEYHCGMKEYEPTPLISLKGLAERLGVKGVLIKDESKRFGLNAFKALGGSYAVSRLVETNALRPENRVFVTATDGNHGRGVAWIAHKYGGKAYVFMPKGTVSARAEAIRNTGDAHVEVLDLNYDECVRHATEFAERNGYFLVQDTGFEGYEDIPNNITLGYTTMAAEAAKQLEEAGFERATHMFLQAGVGSMAGGVLGYFVNDYAKRFGEIPVTAVMEADEAACIYKSIERGAYTVIEEDSNTIMAGLNCQSPNIFTWPVLRDYASWFVSCPDFVTEMGMRQLANPVGNDEAVVSGESGAVGMGLLLSLFTDEYEEHKKAMGIDENSVILMFSTEGNTDPDGYDRICK